MRFDLDMQIGNRGQISALGTIDIDEDDIESISEYAGAYHVLEMGLHYRDYVENGVFPPFPAIQGFPQPFVYQPLENKLRAAGITGNIGEAVAAIVARRVLRLPSRRITHIRTQRPFTRRKTPDYMLRLEGNLPAPVLNHLPVDQGVRLPFWWPAESKARVDPSSASAGVEDAFRQLAAYWYSIHDSLLWRDDVGFGIVFSFVYERSPGVHVHFFLPRDANGLRDLLRSFPDYDAYAEHLEEDPNRHKETHPCLHLDA